VGRSQQDSVGERAALSSVVGEDGMRNDGRRGVAAGRINACFYFVCREDLEGRNPGGLGERVRVDSQEEGAVRAICRPIVTDGPR
jgi:hypothetical protein